MSAASRLPLLALAALLITLPALEGCGKKPALLDPPEGSGPEAALFPRHYPSPKYDPPAPGRPAAPAVQPGPLLPDQTIPQIIRPETIDDPTVPAVPESGEETAWPNSTESKP